MNNGHKAKRHRSPGSWAPADLKELYRRRHELTPPVVFSSVHELAIEILERFVTDPDMSEVWPKLRARTTEKNLRYGREPYPFGRALFHCSQVAIVDWRRQPKHTASQKRQVLANISEKITELVTLIEDSKYFSGCEVEELMEDSEIRRLIDAIEPNRGGLPSTGEQNSGDRRDTDVLWLRAMTWGNVPTVSSLLKRLAKRASKRSASSQVWTRKPGAPGAESHFFARSISAYFKRQYGHHWDESVAIVTNVALRPDPKLDLVHVQGLRRSLNFDDL